MELTKKQTQEILESLSQLEDWNIPIAHWLQDLQDAPEAYNCTVEEVKYVIANRAALSNIGECLDCSPAGEPC